MLRNGLNKSLPVQVKKIVDRVETQRLTGEKKITSLAISKEGHADCLLGYERTIHY